MNATHPTHCTSPIRIAKTNRILVRGSRLLGLRQNQIESTIDNGAVMNVNGLPAQSEYGLSSIFYYVLGAVRKSGGWGEAVTDAEIVEGIRLLARTEGIFTEPAGGTTVAVTRKLIELGRIPRDEQIVICVTGNGYKTIEAVQDAVPDAHQISARLEDFDTLYEGLQQKTGVRRSA